MKKNIINISLIIVGILVVSVVGIKAATTIGANMVTYNNTTVKETLDDLVDITVKGTATSADIASGKTAVVKGELITGTAKETFLEGYTQVAEESTPISWDGINSPTETTFTTTYTPTKDCSYIIFSYMTTPHGNIIYSYDGSSGEPFSEDSIFKRILKDNNNEKWSIRRGTAKAGETITASFYAYAKQSYHNLYNVIYTDENL